MLKYQLYTKIFIYFLLFNLSSTSLFWFILSLFVLPSLLLCFGLFYLSLSLPFYFFVLVYFISLCLSLSTSLFWFILSLLVLLFLLLCFGLFYLSLSLPFYFFVLVILSLFVPPCLLLCFGLFYLSLSFPFYFFVLVYFISLCPSLSTSLFWFILSLFSHFFISFLKEFSLPN